MRQQGGGVVTCAGQPAWLIPATNYAIERLGYIYGGGESGANRFQGFLFSPDPSEYRSSMRSTKCDAQGNFAFEEVADGEYFVTTSVQWVVNYAQQGGNLMQRLRVGNGKIANVVMSS
jgi:hypothetical protein